MIDSIKNKDFINNILIDIIDSDLFISGPYLDDSSLSYCIDRGINEEEIYEREFGSSNAIFSIFDLEESISRLVIYTGLRYEFYIGNFLHESKPYLFSELFNRNINSSELYIDFNTRKSSTIYLIIKIFES